MIDTPPLTAVSDAFPLLGKVDGVVIVGRVGRNRRDVAQQLRETLSGAGAPLLGVIANGLKSGRGGSYAYAYNYSYRSGPPAGDAGASPTAAVAWCDREWFEVGQGRFLRLRLQLLVPVGTTRRRRRRVAQRRGLGRGRASADRGVRAGRAGLSHQPIDVAPP